jgi:hypothetical protein
MQMFSKTSDHSRWERIFDFILASFFLLPLLFVILFGTLCESPEGIGSIACVPPAIAPLGYVGEAIIVFLVLLGGILLYGPVILIAYVGSTVHKIRQWRRWRRKQAFDQYRWGLAVWLICTSIICLIVLVSVWQLIRQAP